MRRCDCLAVVLATVVLSNALAGERFAPRLAALLSEPRPADPSELRDGLFEAFALALPATTNDFREKAVQVYVEAKAHKAQAVATPDGPWRVVAAPSVAVAEEKALEACQLRYAKPCALLASDDTVKHQGAGGDWPRPSMARVSFAGAFSVERIPAIFGAVYQRPDIAGYGTAASPKAMAIHPWGRVFVATAAASQKAAEEQALSACNDDSNRAGKDGPCFLYAAGNRVILGLRLKEPRPPATTVANALASMSIAGVADSYAKSAAHKALAVQVESGRTFRWLNGHTAADAERQALEACQLRYGTPCTLIAVDDDLRAPDPYSAARQDMPRLKYSGSYRVEQVPMHYDQEKEKQLMDYADAKGPKAMAIRSNGVVRTATGSTIADAETKALAQCNDFEDSAYPCYLYASNERVVIAERRTEPSR